MSPAAGNGGTNDAYIDENNLDVGLERDAEALIEAEREPEGGLPAPALGLRTSRAGLG